MRVTICVATALEAAGLPKKGTASGVDYRVVTTGVGPVSAAIGLTRALAEESADLVVSLGVGGAYPDSGLEIGDVACADSEYYADLGADSPDGFLDMEAIGFPVVGGHYNRLPVSRRPSTTHATAFVTRSTCTGLRTEADEIVRRSGGAVESMEGAAIVHTAIAHDIDAAEIRGISNTVSDRDRSKWRLEEAATAARTELLQWMEELAC